MDQPSNLSSFLNDPPNYDTPLPLTKFNGKINGIYDTPLHKNKKLNTTAWPTGNYDTPLLSHLNNHL